MISNKENNKKENKELETKPSDFFEDHEYFEVNFATGDQFRKIATLRSKDGPVTDEQVKKF